MNKKKLKCHPYFPNWSFFLTIFLKHAFFIANLHNVVEILKFANNKENHLNLYYSETHSASIYLVYVDTCGMHVVWVWVKEA